MLKTLAIEDLTSRDDLIDANFLIFLGGRDDLTNSVYSLDACGENTETISEFLEMSQDAVEHSLEIFRRGIAECIERAMHPEKITISRVALAQKVHSLKQHLDEITDEDAMDVLETEFGATNAFLCYLNSGGYACA